MVWTTTPWTLPANVAVAVNSEFTYVIAKTADEYFIAVEDLISKLKETLELVDLTIVEKISGKELEGLTYTHPFINRESPVVSAAYVSKEDGTGLVHIAPGHGYDDYLVGKAFNLPTIMPVNEEGVFTKEAEKYEGLKVFEANKLIVADMEATGKLWKLQMIKHSYPHCWRCHSPVIFRATEQWFVAMDNEAQLRAKTLREIKHVRWFPDWGQKRITGMVDVRPDWCISRQRHWGIPIPVFYCKACGKPHYKGPFNQCVVELVGKKGTNAWFTMSADEILTSGLVCEDCGHKYFTKDTNIMDVWLESGASHHAVLNERPELHFPADLYLEGSDQHRGWFQSSLLTSVGAFGQAPYKHVLTHGFTIDEKGQKMSKSLGNVIDPLKVMSTHGADILRLWVGSIDFRNDMILSEKIIGQVKDAFTKIRNTMRFMVSNLYDFDAANLQGMPLLEIDQWIMAKFNELVIKVEGFYLTYELHQIYHHVYNFCVIELSSFYLDIQKDNLYCNEASSGSRRSCQKAMSDICKGLAIMLAPILSFSMEDVYSFLPGKKEASIFMENFPKVKIIENAEHLFTKYTDLIELRSLINVELEKKRQEKIIGSSLEARVIVTTSRKVTAADISAVMIVSKLEVKSGKTDAVEVDRADGEKCARCWKFDELTADGLCKRCDVVVND